ncbi:MAG: hypothetical protein ACLP0B_32355 [Steroidobacteraceae bacterium]
MGTLKDVVLFVVAIYGAVLSTFNWRQAVAKERRKILVSVSEDRLKYEDNRVGEPFANIKATNIGHRAVTVKTLAFELPNGSRMHATADNVFPVISGTVLPASLLDGQSAHLCISYLYIACALQQGRNRGAIKLTPVCEDSVGGIYKGEPWNVDPDKLAFAP